MPTVKADTIAAAVRSVSNEKAVQNSPAAQVAITVLAVRIGLFCAEDDDCFDATQFLKSCE